MSELDDFVGEIQEAPAETVTESPEPSEAKTETATAETTQEVSEEGAPAAPETTDEPVETPKDKSVPLAAVLDERDKRQKAQRRTEELERQLAELQKQEPAPIPDVLDDQAGFTNALQQQMATMGLQLRTEMSQEFMRMQHDDYDATETQFTAMATENPQLARDLAASPNPAKFAYDTVKKAEKLAKLENVDEYESTLRAEIEAKVRAELTAEITGTQAETAAKAGALTPSIAGQRAAGGNKAIPVEVPDPLETTFKR